MEEGANLHKKRPKKYKKYSPGSTPRSTKRYRYMYSKGRINNVTTAGKVTVILLFLFCYLFLY